MAIEIYNRLGFPRSEVRLIEPVHSKCLPHESLPSYLARIKFKQEADLLQLLSDSSLKTKSQHLANYLITRTREVPASLIKYNKESKAVIAALSFIEPSYKLDDLVLHTRTRITGIKAHELKPRDHLSWCKLCLRQQKENDETIYYPACWLAKQTQYCAIHSMLLSHSCPQCGYEIKSLNRHTMKGLCSRCHEHLCSDKSCRHLSGQLSFWQY